MTGKLSLLLFWLLFAGNTLADTFNPTKTIVLSQRALTLVFTDKSPEQLPMNARSWHLHSTSDKRFSLPVSAIATGVDRQVVAVNAMGETISETRLHLLFPKNMKAEQAYEVQGPEKQIVSTLRFFPSARSPSIQANQVGYLRCSKKIAYAGNWLGTAGPLPIEDLDFSVIDTRNKAEVYSGVLTLRKPYDKWSGNHVYEADFSPLQQTGEFRLSVPGLGVSDAFRIDPAPYTDLYRSIARLFYHKRNSTPVTKPWADPGYERPEGGVPAELNGRFHSAVGTAVLRNRERPGLYQEVSKGWFDAGDYGQYIPNAAPVWYAISAAMDIDPDRFHDNELNIPESGNTIPDILDELNWGMAWALSMQDATDGGVWFRIASENWDESLPWQIRKTRLIFEKTTHATASFAAMAAIHARLIKPWDADLAARSLRAAEQAWHFLETHPQWPGEKQLYKNPKGTHAGEYADPSATDNRLWAAAELLRSTGKQTYADAFSRLYPKVKFDPTSDVTFKNQAMAALWAYAMTPDSLTKRSLSKAARNHLLAGANWRIQMASEHPYRAAMHHHIPSTGWGSFAQSTRATLPLLQAWTLTGDDKYRQWAKQTPNPQLGANPQGLCYITGIGSRSPRHPLSKLMQYGQSLTPLKGLPINGPHYNLPRSWASTRAVMDGYYPGADGSTDTGFSAKYPALRRYTDASPLPPMSEPTIADYAYTAMAYALLGSDKMTACEPE